MSQWVRLLDDMPTDPKWRVVSRRAGRPLPEVLSVFVFMMTNAGANANERGRMLNWSDEDVGAALDMDAEHVASIREAMQGKTLEGDRLSGWDRIKGPAECLRPSGGQWSEIRSYVFERDDYTCAYCGLRGVKLECDHVVPVSRGGSNHTDNLVTSCFRCNRDKGTKLLSEWRP